MTLSVRLTHRFPGLVLDVGFTASAGITALFGPSGSGKTSVVNAVAGLLRPDSGQVTAGGMTLFDSAKGLHMPPHQRRIGYVFQDARLFPHLTVRQNLLYSQRFAPKAATFADLNHITDLLGITDLLQRRPARLSGGETSRVALGRAILSAPRILLMDEPLAALDPARKAEILPYIERLRDEVQLPILYVSHSLDEVMRLAATTVILEKGRVIAAGPSAEALSSPAVQAQLGADAMGAVIRARIEGQEPDGLTRFASAAGPILLPNIRMAPGKQLHLRVLARDVMLAKAAPEGISALNILPVTVTEIREDDPDSVLVRLAFGVDEVLLSRITRRSCDQLGLHPGQGVFAIIKAVSITPG